MNAKRPQSLPAILRRMTVGLMLLIFVPAGLAQQVPSKRWLLIFDTSSAMKKDLPATTEAVRKMLSLSADGQMHEGDSVGIWTYDQRLHSGEVPLLTWKPGQAAMIISNLTSFLHHQRYHDGSNLPVIQTLLPRVIAYSRQLTILIFCDGHSPLRGTPYDVAINQSFQDRVASQEKAREPFVITLRTQMGKYVGCTLSYPPGNISFPPFPKLPPPTHPKPKPKAPAPVAKKRVVPRVTQVPPLVIVGTQVSTNLNAVPQSASAPAMTNTVKPVVAAHKTVLPAKNKVIKKTTVAPATNSPPAPAKPVSSTASGTTHAATNLSATTTSPTRQPPPKAASATLGQATASHNSANFTIKESAAPAVAKTHPARKQNTDGVLVWLGTGLLAAALVVGLLIWRSPRRSQGSLISRSMQDDSARK